MKYLYSLLLFIFFSSSAYSQYVDCDGLVLATFTKRGHLLRIPGLDNKITTINEQLKTALSNLGCELNDQSKLADLIKEYPYLTDSLSELNRSSFNSLRKKGIKSIALGEISKDINDDYYYLYITIYDVNTVGKVLSRDEIFIHKGRIRNGMLLKEDLQEFANKLLNPPYSKKVEYQVSIDSSQCLDHGNISIFIDKEFKGKLTPNRISRKLLLKPQQSKIEFRTTKFCFSDNVNISQNQDIYKFHCDDFEPYSYKSIQDKLERDLKNILIEIELATKKLGNLNKIKTDTSKYSRVLNANKQIIQKYFRDDDFVLLYNDISAYDSISNQKYGGRFITSEKYFFEVLLNQHLEIKPSYKFNQCYISNIEQGDNLNPSTCYIVIKKIIEGRRVNDNYDYIDTFYQKIYFQFDKKNDEGYISLSNYRIYDIAYSKPPKDTDEDGVIDIDEFDKCIGLKGPPCTFGCPDEDNDCVKDAKDFCPKTKGVIQFNGCPDTDGDGIPDYEDNCPKKKGSFKFNGCPDTDRDGIPNHEDDCPEVKGSFKCSGCPDYDKDNIRQSIDKCPCEFGTIENLGCREFPYINKKITKHWVIRGGLSSATLVSSVILYNQTSNDNQKTIYTATGALGLLGLGYTYFSHRNKKTQFERTLYNKACIDNLQNQKSAFHLKVSNNSLSLVYQF